MRLQESSANILSGVRLPQSVTSYLETDSDQNHDGYPVIGGILRETKYAWLSSGSKFTVIDLNTGQKIAAWTFGATLKDFKARVSCVSEITVPLVDNTLQLLIGLECELIGGMICVFHCNGSRVLRAIRVDCQVICMQYIERMPGSPLDCYDGAILMGAHGGAAFILDLNRDACTNAIFDPTGDSDRIVRDELNFANLVALSIDNIDLLHEQRTIALDNDHHMAVQINEGCVHNVNFVLHNPDNTIKLRVERENVYVTSVLFVPRIMSVVIGLNVGAFQIWNVLTLELEFTSRINADGLPITHLAFLEPCDDPRAFCYLWAVHSVLDRHEDGFPLATMYSITYEEKRLINNEFLYRNFISCNLCFNMELANVDAGNDFTKNFVGGRCIGCQSLVKTTNKEEADEYELNVCQIVWECWTSSAISPMRSMMVLFDIDQWYKEHMPDCTDLKTNNFISIIKLGDSFTHTTDSYLCDVKIASESLTSYFSVQRLEEHFFPNALGYECFYLTNHDITKFMTMGIQRQLLASINEGGPSILLHPSNLFQQCVSAGLVPMYVDPPVTSVSEIQQRNFLLSVALEARLIQFLGKCACDWATGSHTSIGCTLQTLLNWAWNRALSLKRNGDLLTVSFFNQSGEIPDRNTIQQLDSCVRQIGHIASLFNIILEKCSSYTLPEVYKEIQQRQKIIQMVAQYFQVIQWFLNIGLLPETHIEQLSDGVTDRLAYPIDALTEFYQNRRLKLHCLNGENPTNQNLRNKNCKLLFIDQFIKLECSEEKLRKLWLEDKSISNGLYPPPSLHSLLKIYLIPEVKEEHKHSLILYTLIDYAMIFDNERYEGFIRRLMQFPTMFGLSNTAIKVTQAFWHLDHRDFQLALNQLQCVLAGGCLSQWQHDVVLSSLLVQKKTQSALQYLHVRKPLNESHETDCNIYDDWEACSNLYLCRGLIYEAFSSNKDASKDLSSEQREGRFLIFLNSCYKMGMLPKALSLPLSKFEENIFVKYLKGLDDPSSKDILVMFYLYRSRYIEAQKINEDLKRLTVKNQLPYNVTSSFSLKKGHVYKTETRDQLVELYYKTLPPITRQLASIVNNHTARSKVTIPTPMTVTVQTNTCKTALCKSTLIQASIDKANETWMDKPCVVRGLKRLHEVEDTPFVCTPKISKTESLFYEKMNITPDVSPAKKSKLDIDINDTSKTVDKNVNAVLENEIKTILHTPLVERKSKWSTCTNIDQYSIDKSASERESTPRSILKARKLKCMPSSIFDRYLAETDDELDTASQYTQSDNLSRSIRFKVPSRNNSPSQSSEYMSDVQDSFSDLCGDQPFEHASDHKRSLNITGSSRKSLHDSVVNDVYMKESFSNSVRQLSTVFKDNTSSDSLESNEPIQTQEFKGNLTRRLSASLKADNLSTDSIESSEPKEIEKSFRRKSIIQDINNELIESHTPIQSEEISQIKSYIRDDSVTNISQDKTDTSTPNVYAPKARRSLRLSNLKNTSKSPIYETISKYERYSISLINKSSKNINNESLSQPSKSNKDEKEFNENEDFKTKNISRSRISIVEESKNITHSRSINVSTSMNTSILPSELSEEISDVSLSTIRDASIDHINISREHSKNENVSLLSITAQTKHISDKSDADANQLKDAFIQEASIVSCENDNISNKDSQTDNTSQHDEISNDIVEIDPNKSKDNSILPAIISQESVSLPTTCNVSVNFGDSSVHTAKIDDSIDDKTLEINVNKSKNECSDDILSENHSDKSCDSDLNQGLIIDDSQITDVNYDENVMQSSINLKVIDENIRDKVDIESQVSLIDPSKISTSENLSDDLVNKGFVDSPASEITSDSRKEDESRLEKNISTTDLLNTSGENKDNNVDKKDISQSSSRSEIKNTYDIVKEQDDKSTSELEICTESSMASSTVTSEKMSNSLTPAKTRRSSSFSRKRTPRKSIDSDAESSSTVENAPRQSKNEYVSNAKIIKTPRRTPRKSKDSSDENSSVSSCNSVVSSPSLSNHNTTLTSEASIDSDQESTSMKRKFRRSILAQVKPNLSVIPEMSQDDEKLSLLNRTGTSKIRDDTSLSIDIDKYSSSRRLTRHQKSLLEKSLDNTVSKETSKNITSVHETIIEVDSENDNESVASNYTTETLDPILLLDKNDFKGQPDPDEKVVLDEIYNFSRESSVISNRLEIETANPTKENTPESTRSKQSRRSKISSVEVCDSPMKSVNAVKDDNPVDSPSTRLRRKSFNRAVEALTTPRKNRRLSTDSKKSEVDTPTKQKEDIIEEEIPEKVEEKVETPTPRRSKRQKAASIHGQASVSDIDNISNSAKKVSRKTLFVTTISEEDRMSLIGNYKEHPKYKRKTGVYKVIRPLEYDTKKN